MGTHASNIIGSIQILTAAPSAPITGDEYYDKRKHAWFRWSGNNWLGAQFTPTSVAASNTIVSSTPGTHFSALQGTRRTAAADPAGPSEGDFYFDTVSNRWAVYENGQWSYASLSTTTSTSSSTTTTSSSTTTTSTSSSSSTSSSTSTTTSTTTTL